MLNQVFNTISDYNGNGNGWQIRFQKSFEIIVLEMFLIKIENIYVSKEKNIEV